MRFNVACGGGRTYRFVHFVGEEKRESARNEGSDYAHQAVQDDVGVRWDDRHD